MTTFCGLDFGTSNSTIGTLVNNSCQLVPLENDKVTLRSAIFCDIEMAQWVFGQEGVNRYLEGVPGRLMTSLKTVLGSSLMDEKTVIFNKLVPYTQVLFNFMRHIKNLAEKATKKELTRAVFGRPVYFHDHDPQKDQQAQNTLEAIGKDLGFTEIVFQYEPIAAARAYEATISQEQLALIVDIGGGTSDFTVIRLHPKTASHDRSKDLLANNGVHIAGNNFDQKLSLTTVMPLLGMGTKMRGSSSEIEVPSSFYHDLTTWHTLSNLYSAKTIAHLGSLLTVANDKEKIQRLISVLKDHTGHHILDAVEKNKQHLSTQTEALLQLDFIEDDLKMLVRRTTFHQAISTQLEKILATVKQTLQMAQVRYEEISAIFYTGGSSKIPIIREQINSLFPAAKVIQGDAFGSVGLGLTIEAQRLFQH